MPTFNIPEPPLTWDMNYTINGYVGALYFEGREIFSLTMDHDKEYFAAQDEFLDTVADKLRKVFAS